MSKPTIKPFGAELEERCLRLALDVAIFCRSLKKDYILFEYCAQLIRAASSVGANYIEANESLSKKDFLNRAKICRKEAKETRLWLRLVYISNDNAVKQKRIELLNETDELLKIFGSIIAKSQ